MRKLTKRLPTAITAAMLMSSAVVSAGPVIGFDPTGTGTYTTYADLWTNVTDSALSVGFIPSPAGTSLVPYDTTLIAQAVIGTMSNSNTPALVTPAGLNTTYEISKVTSFNETVVSQTATTAQFTLAAGSQPDIDLVNAGSQQLMIFFDDITDGSKAVPGNGVGTVSNYTDGILILSAHAIDLSASFAASGSVGTGSFDVKYQIDYVNPLYLDVVSSSIFGDKMTGTTNIPSFFNPANMWDGTSVKTGLLLKVDSSESFKVPEPGIITLIGLGLVGLGFVRRRTNKV